MTKLMATESGKFFSSRRTCEVEAQTERLFPLDRSSLPFAVWRSSGGVRVVIFLSLQRGQLLLGVFNRFGYDYMLSLHTDVDNRFLLVSLPSP